VRLRIVGESAAGKGWHNETRRRRGRADYDRRARARRRDSVQQVELAHELKDGTVVELLESVELGKSNRRARRGDQGRRNCPAKRREINAAMMAVLAAFGYAEVAVSQRPRVGILATGSELVIVEENPARIRFAIPTTTRLAAYAQLAGAVVQRLPLARDETSVSERPDRDRG
jgi:molybdopterin molybdotransferase